MYVPGGSGYGNNSKRTLKIQTPHPRDLPEDGNVGEIYIRTRESDGKRSATRSHSPAGAWEIRARKNKKGMATRQCGSQALRRASAGCGTVGGLFHERESRGALGTHTSKPESPADRPEKNKGDAVGGLQDGNRSAEGIPSDQRPILQHLYGGRISADHRIFRKNRNRERAWTKKSTTASIKCSMR